MIQQRQPILVGFEYADSANALLATLGFAPDLGVVLANHLTTVLREQYTDLDIESIELVKTRNCDASGFPNGDFQVIDIDSVTMPVDIVAVVVARKERYRLMLHVVLKAQKAGECYEVKSDVRIDGQLFLGLR